MGGNDFLYEEILEYCENDYELMKETLDYLYNRLKLDMEKED